MSKKYVICFSLLSCLIFVVILISSILPVRKPKVGPTEHGLRIIKVEMGNGNGDGMDGGFFGNTNWGGGKFSFKFCFQINCCETGVLETEDDNWEKGEINYFVGYQIGACENFPLDSEGALILDIF